MDTGDLFAGLNALDEHVGLSVTVSPPLPSATQLAWRVAHEDDSTGNWTDWTAWRNFATL